MPDLAAERARPARVGRDITAGERRMARRPDRVGRLRSREAETLPMPATCKDPCGGNIGTIGNMGV